MIDTNLVNAAVSDYNQYRSAQPGELPALFLGFVMTNEYDNRRLKLNEKYNPVKLMYLHEDIDKSIMGVMLLYGLLLPLNELGSEMHKKLLERDNDKGMDTDAYKDIIGQYNLSCNNSSYCLRKRIYPVDFKYFKKLTDDEIIEDEKILQHLLGIDDNKYAVEEFGAFKVVILT